jgi:hypothetical protein
MIVSIEDDNGEDFLRHWSERVYDQIQLAQIAAIEDKLVAYAMTAWRPMKIDPPIGGPVLGACEEGVIVMSQSALGEWRTRDGLPHKPPRAWMPCPLPPR